MVSPDIKFNGLMYEFSAGPVPIRTLKDPYFIKGLRAANCQLALQLTLADRGIFVPPEMCLSQEVSKNLGITHWQESDSIPLDIQVGQILLLEKRKPNCSALHDGGRKSWHLAYVNRISINEGPMVIDSSPQIGYGERSLEYLLRWYRLMMVKTLSYYVPSCQEVR